MQVTVSPDEPLEVALRRFRRVCSKNGLIAEIKRRAFYVKPSERKRESIRKAQRRAAKKRRF